MNLIVKKLSQFFQDDHLVDLYQKVVLNRDIYYDLNYLKINDHHEQGDTFVAIYIEENAIQCIYPFIKRSFECNQEIYYDIKTPYEYGGECLLNEQFSTLIDFRAEFEKYCIKNKIVTEFQRINPLLDYMDQRRSLSGISVARDNIVINLKESEEKIFSDYHKNNRRDIRLAIRKGVKVVQKYPSSDSIEEFCSLYLESMDEKNAKAEYYFSPSYFNNLIHLNKNNLLIYFAYTPEGQLASTAMILTKGKHAHYHLSANNREYTKLCANNLLLHQVSLDLKKDLVFYFHLGGASQSQKGLYAFKSKFSKLRKEYYVRKNILDQKLYSKICDQTIKDKELSPEKIDENYFPMYRGVDR